jgi:acyl carrier protein
MTSLAHREFPVLNGTGAGASRQPSARSRMAVQQFRPFPIGENRLCSAHQALRPPSAALPKESTLSTTFDKVANIIAETSEIDRDKITPESHTIDDLGIDSLDFLDIVFAIDKEFGIKVPLEKWTQEVNDGKVSTDEYFVMKNLCAKIDGLVAAKAAA